MSAGIIDDIWHHYCFSFGWEDTTLGGVMRLLILFILLISGLFAQNDSVYVEIKGDTAIFWHKNAECQCAAKYQFAINLTDTVITITEEDTSTQYADCICNYSFSITAGPFTPGKYTAVFNQNCSGFQAFIGNCSFEIPVSSNRIDDANTDTLQILASYNSGCYDILNTGDDVIVTDRFALYQNFPNPFNANTSIPVTVDKTQHARVEIYNILGKRVAILFHGEMETGKNHYINFNASFLPSGIYFCRFSGESGTVTRKMMLIK